MIRSIAAVLTAGVSIVALASPVHAETREYALPAGSLEVALDAFVKQSGQQVIYRAGEIRSARTQGARGQFSASAALQAVLAGTGFSAHTDRSGALAIVRSRIAPAASQQQDSEAAPEGRPVEGGDNAAQTPDIARSANSERDIVVTGTRIRRDGYDAPVPVNVLGREEINALKPANIADLVRTLPAIAAGGTNSAISGGNNMSAGLFGVNTINLRGLGASRTLVLLNGQRTVASTFNGLVDVNTFPQDLIERVEIVTGGASAQYGSDAVGGVVNFILDEKFKGLKVGADTGITTYGDAHNYRFAATAGLSLLDDRLHILLNGSYFHQDGVGSVDRPWNNKGYQLIRNPAYTSTNGQPEYLVGSGFGPANGTKGGMINSGPLKGTYFLEDGVTKQFNYGTTNAFSSPWMIGGDLQTAYDGVGGTTSLVPKEERIGVFNRIAFDVTPDITVYGQFSWNRYKGRANAWAAGDTMTIRADNAYLLTQYPQVAAAMQANGLGSILVGVNNLIYPLFPGPDNSRQVFRYVAGAKGTFSLFDRPWSWDVYYQRGVVKTHEETVNVGNIGRISSAVDAVFSNGQIVCRSTLTDPTNGCVPFDGLGTGLPSAASLAYVFGPEQPWREQKFTQDVASLSFSGALLDLPGGALAIALGGEWRKEQAGGKVGAAASSSRFYVGNYRVNRGEIEVKEGFVEVSLPLFAGLDINAAGRYTDYSTSGSVQTWKVGATYSPIRDVKFRGAYSHDIRAPNMQELFLQGASGSGSLLMPPNSPQPGSQNFTVRTVGNPDLKPERANTLTAGVVVTPSFLPGFSASFDYYNIKLKDVINTVGRQQYIDFCYAGFSQFCPSITLGAQPSLLVQPINFAGQHVSGFDIEASYSTPLSAISSSIPGNLRIHAAATHVIKNVVDNRVFPNDFAGVIADANFGSGAASPSWVYRVSAFYEIDPVTINLVARGFNSGVYSNEWIECTSNCPTSTIFNRTINDNDIDGAMYFDGSVSFKIRSAGNETRLSFIVNNIFNKDPVPFGLDVTGDWVAFPQTARGLYDTVGRVFRVALTSKF